tara:strand:+ start:312 stop:713 length:402 start_codon:yes stop_codon:yes gene_type:complete
MGVFSFLSKSSGNAVGQILEGTNNILDGLITNKEEKAKVFVELSKMQVEINKLEASSPGLFKGGWRPFIGWVCGTAYGFNFVIMPIMNYCLLVFQKGTPLMQPLSLSELAPILLGMLGLGAYRSVDKIMNKSK